MNKHFGIFINIEVKGLLNHDLATILDIDTLAWILYALTLEVVVSTRLCILELSSDACSIVTFTIHATKDWDSNHILVIV